MKAMLTFLLVLAADAALAHDSLVPHHHPHDVSILPGLDTIAVAVIALAAAFIAYAKFGRG
jgi:hypothetical protein